MVFPPADGPAGKNSPLFFENRRQQGLSARDLTEKLVKTGGTPFLSTFWSFWAKVAQTGEFLVLQSIEEKRNIPGGKLRGHLGVYFVRTVSPVPKYTLGWPLSSLP